MESIKKLLRKTGMERHIFSFSGSYKDHIFVHSSYNVSYDTVDTV